MNKKILVFALIYISFLTLFFSCELEGKFEYPSYTVVYNANGGKGYMEPSVLVYGEAGKLRKNTFTYEGYNFLGWTGENEFFLKYNDEEEIKNLTNKRDGKIYLYAIWAKDGIAYINVPDGTLNDKLNWLKENAVSNTGYNLEVDADETIPRHTLSYGGIRKDKDGNEYDDEGKNISIILKGVGGERIINFSSTGPMFTVETGITLILDENITLCGINNNNAALVKVNNGGTFIMKSGSAITGNTSTSNGGGVNISTTGTFIMEGGTIRSNTVSAFSGSGGGVYVQGTFNKTGGTIYGFDDTSGNKVTNSGGGLLLSKGHAVYADGPEIIKHKELTAGPDDNLCFNSAESSFGGMWDYTVTFNGNGATGGSAPEFMYGNTVILPNQGTLVKTSCSFGGWNTEADGTGELFYAEDSFTADNDVTLYAVWESGTVSIVYYWADAHEIVIDADGIGSNNTIEIKSNESVTITPAGNGYTDQRWFINGVEDLSCAGNSSYTFSEAWISGRQVNIDLIVKKDGKWYSTNIILLIGLYTVSYDVNGADGTAPPEQYVLNGMSITLPEQGTLERTGYNFKGWNTDESGSGTNYEAGASFTVTRDITFYANWQLPVPDGITAESDSTDSITVSWNAVPNADSYNVYRSTSSNGSYEKINTNRINTTSYTDTGLSAGTRYYYKVSAVISSAESSLSVNASAITLSDGLAHNTWHTAYLSAGTVDYYTVYLYSGNTYYVYTRDSDNYDISYADVKVGVIREGSYIYTYSVTDTNSISFYVSTSGNYTIEIHGLNSTSSGYYEIRYY